MNAQMKLYWDTYFEHYNTHALVRKSPNYLREYEDDLAEGQIMELGCGQSNYCIEYCQSGRTVFAIDNDQEQLAMLQERITKLSPENINNLKLLNATILQDPLPDEIFSVVIISNLLHFFSIDDCKKIIEQIVPRTKSGSIILVSVHSDKHYANNPNDPHNNNYFKHYFTENDLTTLFDEKIFEMTFLADIQKKLPKIEIEIIDKWLDKVLNQMKVIDKKLRQVYKNGYLNDKQESDRVAIFKRK
ncbi:SAM-dependent methyltransferase [Filimonas zeae]|uniref:Methyltransferase domain-containing protein n=1 Tax=Filimonas zeae TaxID=1737353 RepID=A0A917MRW4_9BACT|nr:class I SAM-dependent methyltransferase [Filimonas zeae]MDR6337667.1 SAM-dependent methyltransferase [Filimonas zeae]GGH59703.1 hypothetical protein GCM10011379_06770 [Filimonas zeae]